MYKEPGAYTNIEKGKEIKFVVEQKGLLDDTAPVTSTDKVWSVKKNNTEFAKQNEVKKVSSVLENVKQEAYFDKRSYRNKLKKPLITFITDDGAIGDWEKLKPLSEKYKIPFTSAVITGQMGMSWEQINFLEKKLNWEIASHTHTHSRLANLTETQIDFELKNSKKILMENGIDVKNIVYPFGSENTLVRQIASKYYNCGAIVGIKNNININFDGVPTFRIIRSAIGSNFDVVDGVDTTTLNYYKSKVDECERDSGWLVYMIHPSYEQHTQIQQQNLEEVIKYIKSKNIDIVNLDDGFKNFGNILEVGDYYIDNKKCPVITSEGKLLNFNDRIKLISKNGITSNTPITNFANEIISITSFVYSDNSGFPHDGAGTLVVNRLNNDDNFNFQTFFCYTGQIYIRYCTNSGYSEFNKIIREKDLPVPVAHRVAINKIKENTLINQIEFGITLLAVVGWTKGNGIVITYRVGENGFDRQEFKSTNGQTFVRLTNSDGQWGNWI